VFENEGIPFQIASRETVVKQPGLADLLSYFKVVNQRAGFSDYETVMRLAFAGIGNKTMEIFKDWCFWNGFSPRRGLRSAKRFPITGLSTARQQVLNEFWDHIDALETRMNAMTVAQQLEFLTQYDARVCTLESDRKTKDAYAAMTEWAAQFDRRADDFIASLALHTDTDAWAGRAEKVSLMTMHAAKGLEFSIVFISGCERGYIPFQPASGEMLGHEIQEERRLFYVAMTRAMARLYFTFAKKRRIYGRVVSRSPSPFVADIETRLILDESPRLTKKKNKNDQKQLSLFQ
jgi:superfamily I DNA/RNA helicase